MIYVHLADGFEEIEAVTIIDVLRRADLDVRFVSMEKNLLVRGAHDIHIEADVLFDDADYVKCEMIVLPGGMPGTKHLGEHKDLLAKIKEFNNKDKYLAAICAAPMVLAQAGILKDRAATIFQGMEDKLLDAKFKEESVVVDGKIITSRGPGTAFEFVLKLVEVFKDKSAADELRQAMMIK